MIQSTKILRTQEFVLDYSWAFASLRRKTSSKLRQHPTINLLGAFCIKLAKAHWWTNTNSSVHAYLFDINADAPQNLDVSHIIQTHESNPRYKTNIKPSLTPHRYSRRQHSPFLCIVKSSGFMWDNYSPRLQGSMSNLMFHINCLTLRLDLKNCGSRWPHSGRGHSGSRDIADDDDGSLDVSFDISWLHICKHPYTYGPHIHMGDPICIYTLTLSVYRLIQKPSLGANFCARTITGRRLFYLQSFSNYNPQLKKLLPADIG